jgi:putative transposase
MDEAHAEAVALHRWAVIAEATSDRLEPSERGALVRAIAAGAHTHPDGTARHYSRATIDRWIRAWRRGGLDALRPETRSDTGAVRAHPELADEAAALRLELPSRSAAQIARILLARHGIRVAERTVRQQLARRGLSREALAAEPKAFGRYEAAAPNERWITDVLSGPGSRTRESPTSVRAKLFLIVDDHSRLLVHGRFFAHENARACQEALRQAIVHRGLPEVLYADNGAPFKNAWLTRTCGGARDPPGALEALLARGPGQAGAPEPLYPRGVPQEAMHQGIESLSELDDLFDAWAEQVANRRIHAETNEAPIERFEPERAAPRGRPRAPEPRPSAGR